MININKKIIIDSTLRDGEQCAGVAFSINQRKKIAELLSASGVDEIEAGTPVMGEEDVEFLKWASHLPVKVSSWCRADPRDIDAAKRTGTSGIHISVPVSDRLLKIQKKNHNWVEDVMSNCVDACFCDFETVSIGFMDASRTNIQYLKYLTNIARQLGCNRVRIADTAGIMTPSEVINMFKILSEINIETEFHAHNDLGMATANAFTALDAGADAISGTVLGLGERAGNACIEEIGLTQKLKGQSTRIDLKVLKQLSNFIEEITGRDIYPGKPVFGKNVFCHETGIHAAATIEDPLAFMPVSPEKLGIGCTSILSGRHSGTKAVQYLLSKSSLEIDRETAEVLLPFIRQYAAEHGRNLSPGELENLYHEHADNVRKSTRGIMQAV
ncbi:MAG: hypothetical protein PQJ46_03300 [Spirochaetales bacterium]|nr:hypothetical protein [Spirochaetales bacterium]